jgi:transposase-like protein
MTDLTSPIYNDEDAAREHIEAQRWPDGPTCPHCGCSERIGKLEGKAHRKGVYQCGDCREQFTVTVGTLMESSHIPMHKWVLAFHLMGASKKGISALQMQRMLGLGSYRSAWFLCHRIREAMRDTTETPMGGQNKVVEVDETYVGGKARNRKHKVPNKEAVVALVERDGKVRSFHVATVTSGTLRPIIKAHVDRATYMMTDDSPIYPSATQGMGGHGSVNHSAEEYVRATFWHTNTVEGYFSLLKRAVYGTFHHVSPAHLHRYAAEADFKYNHRIKLGYDDDARALIALKGIEGKRLTYRRTGRAQ